MIRFFVAEITNSDMSDHELYITITSIYPSRDRSIKIVYEYINITEDDPNIQLIKKSYRGKSKY